MSPTDEQAPFLSVTVLNYNYAHYLPKCLDSILGQTMTDFELILINDCSKDNSLDVIQPHLRDPRVKLVNHVSNQGYVYSLVEGCALSRGRYISVISADDYALDNTAFETARRVLEADATIALFFSAWREMDDAGHIRYERRAANRDYVVEGVEQFRHQLFTSDILHSGTIIRRDAYHAVGGYDTCCRYAVDNNMWLALCSTGKVAYSNRVLYAYRAHATNLSNTGHAFWQTTEEMLKGIDAALDRFPQPVLPDKAALRRQARQRALVAVPTHDIFAGRLRRGWHGYWEACRRYPGLTILQPRTVVVVLRTVLGGRLYSRLLRLRGTFKSSRSVLRTPVL